MSNEVIRYLEREIKKDYGTDIGEKGWINIYITPLNRIDITIVAEEVEELDENSIEQYIMQLVEHKNEDNNNKYIIGFTEIYLLSDAEFMGIQKTDIKKDAIMWQDVINPNEVKLREKKHKSYSIISFYSYKGGVGRTIGLIQTAYNMAKQGKRVLIIDMDLEAPSLHKIFANQINNEDENVNVKCGLVDYLFERLISSDGSEKKIQIDDIFFELSIEEQLLGGIYVIPATKIMNSQYIYKLSQLQSKIIHEDAYFEEMINEIYQRINCDNILIDTRTGLNQWGAFSLFGYADQVVLMTYPNEENVEGNKLVIEVMENAGMKNYVVVMSKIPANKEGLKRTKKLFDEFQISQYKPIAINYDTSIATASQYPLTEQSYYASFSEISDFLLESDKIEKNIERLKQYNKREVLTHCLKGISSIDIKFQSETKVMDSRNVLLVRGNEKWEKEHFKVSLNEQIFERVVLKTIKELPNLSDFKNNSMTKVMAAYILYLIYETEIESNILKSLDKKERDLYYCLDKLSSINHETELITIFENVIQEETEFNIFTRLFIVFENVGDVKSKDELKTLILIAQSLKSIFEIRLIFYYDISVYKSVEGFMPALKGNILDLKQVKSDIELLIKRALNDSLFNFILKGVQVENDTDGDLEEAWGLIDDFGIIDDEKHQEMLDLFWGVRSEVDKFSMMMIDWFYEKLKENNIMEPKKVLSIIKRAIDFELNSEVMNDRLININSFEKALKQEKRITNLN